jgi:hypothetical protein
LEFVVGFKMGDVAGEKVQGKAVDHDSGEASSSGASATPAKTIAQKKPVVIIVIGMAGGNLSLLELFSFLGVFSCFSRTDFGPYFHNNVCSKPSEILDPYAFR